MRLPSLQSDLLRYILENHYKPGDQLPTIQEISRSLNISVAKMREELEIARAFGLVEVKPGRGMRVLDYRFAPAMTISALYAIGQNSSHFEQLRRMRNALEIAFWEEAVARLTAEDIRELRALIVSAQERLATQPIQVPANEHRAFHLMIFARLENPFVSGVLEAFWEVYEAFGLNLYFELDYHRKVWAYHAQIVDAIVSGDIEASRRLLIDHMNLLQSRDRSETGQPQPATRFE